MDKNEKRYIVTPTGKREASILHGWHMDGDERWMLKYIKDRKTPASRAEVINAYNRETGMGSNYAGHVFKRLAKSVYIKSAR